MRWGSNGLKPSTGLNAPRENDLVGKTFTAGRPLEMCMSGTETVDMTGGKRGGEDRDRNEDGVYVETYPLEDFLDCLEGEGLTTTKNIAECVGASYQTTYRKLRMLEDDGAVESQMLGGTRVWQIDDGDGT